MVETEDKVKTMQSELDRRGLIINNLYEDIARRMKANELELKRRNEELQLLMKRISYLEYIISKKNKQIARKFKLF